MLFLIPTEDSYYLLSSVLLEVINNHLVFYNFFAQKKVHVLLSRFYVNINSMNSLRPGEN